MVTRRLVLGSLATVSTAAALCPFAAADDHATAEIQTALRQLLSRDPLHAEAGLATLRNYGEPDIAPGLIFALRFAALQHREIAALLTQLTGETARTDWFDWMLWQQAHPEIVPHPAYQPFKREIFLMIDPNFEALLIPAFLEPDRMRIRFEEVSWGGVPMDGIPALDFPDMIPADDADYLRDDDLVFGVAVNGDVRAYPLRIMGWHEMFNDVIGGVPLALAYCTLCGAGILFETQVEGRDEPFIFGSSGFLYRSNKLMFDRQTYSLWNHFTGEPVIGQLAGSGIALRQRPVVIVPWGTWRTQNPQTTVLSLDTGHNRDYGSGVVYREYFASPDLMFPAIADETRLAQKDYVFGIRTFGAAKAWPLAVFAGGRVINDSVGQLNVVLIGDQSGRTVRAYDRGAIEFAAADRPDRLMAGTTPWQITEEAVVDPDGASAPRVPGHVAYWFAWDGYMGIRSELYQE